VSSFSLSGYFIFQRNRQSVVITAHDRYGTVGEKSLEIYVIRYGVFSFISLSLFLYEEGTADNSNPSPVPQFFNCGCTTDCFLGSLVVLLYTDLKKGNGSTVLVFGVMYCTS
jgi:hypothetical protein